MIFPFMLVLVRIVDQFANECGIVLCHEHRGFWAQVAPQFEGGIYYTLGYELVRAPQWIFKSCFLEKKSSFPDRIEIIGDRKIPEHEAFATKTLDDFHVAVKYLGNLPGLTEIEGLRSLGSEDTSYVAMFRVEGFDKAIEIVFRPEEDQVFDPRQVFG